jgi:hypothetical protein
MPDNVFMENSKELTLADYLQYAEEGRGNLGDSIPLLVYRLLEYSLREELKERLGKDTQADIFRSAGFRAGSFFARHHLDTTLPFNQFLAQLQTKIEELRIGVLRIEKIDPDTGRIILTVSEDADCSGLPLLGETVCNYDEGFLSGILSSYTGDSYSAVEVDCWATGSRVCRFQLTNLSIEGTI